MKKKDTEIQEGNNVAKLLASSGTREDDHIEALMAELAAAKTEITRLKTENERLAELAMKDQLTGLINRRGVEDFYSRKKNEKSHDPSCGFFGLIFLDIDRFKEVNDTYGHDVGDEVLKHVANIIRAVKREADLEFRWGGEEMGVLFEMRNKASFRAAKRDAIRFGERLREKIQQTPFVSDKDKALVIKITASIGISVVDSQTKKTLEEFIKMADSHMYTAKNEGRNCTVFSSSEDGSSVVYKGERKDGLEEIMKCAPARKIFRFEC